MNYIIERLVEQAPYTTVSSEGRLFTQQDVAVFADLVINECADYANWYQANNHYTDIAKAIRDHFGVKQ